MKFSGPLSSQYLGDCLTVAAGRTYSSFAAVGETAASDEPGHGTDAVASADYLGAATEAPEPSFGDSALDYPSFGDSATEALGPSFGDSALDYPSFGDSVLLYP